MPYFLASILSAFLLTIAWPTNGYAVPIFFAFVPIFIVQEWMLKQPSVYFFVFSFLCFLLWNLFTTWWIYNASIGGAVMAILANSILMALVFSIFHSIKKQLNASVFIVIPLWLAFEYLHLNWDISWPWLTLGNVFSENHKWIQWYEFTGVLGGSFWILLINCVVYNWIVSASKKLASQWAAIAILLLVAPLVFSFYLYEKYAKHESNDSIQVSIIQPNIDPYNEKFGGLSNLDQLNKLVVLAKPTLDSTTDYLIAPETAIASNIWENKLASSPEVNSLKLFLENYPKLKLIIGASTAKAYTTDEKVSETARKFTDEDAYYDAYNTAIQIDNTANIQIYHKSKLVPGVEKIPFPILFKPLEKVAIDLGGTSGSLGIQGDRTVFLASNSKSKIAPVICYESIYGEFVSQYVKNGANFIFIITNDGWWGDTPGYRQHFSYAKLRAIETRRYIARSANTGTSGIINSRGDCLSKTNYWTEAFLKGTLLSGTELTFYVRHGDYLGWFSALASLGLLLFYFIQKITKPEKL